MAQLPPESSPHRGSFSAIGGGQYTGYIIGEGVSESGLPVYVILGDYNLKRYLIVGRVTVPDSTFGVLEYISTARSVRDDYIGNWPQAEVDMAFNELARWTSPEENLDDGLYSFRDIVEFSGHYGVLTDVHFSNERFTWSADEQTLSAPNTEMTIEPASGYALQVLSLIHI